MAGCLALGYWRGLPLLLMASAHAQLNRAPQFVAGGDMARFSLPEDARTGAPVYRLRGVDPEGSRVHYSISGEHFTVDRGSGVVTLQKPLDRETLDLLEVIISITDESVGGVEPNTVSLRREIPVLDVNDNAPVFLGRPYVFTVSESARPGISLYSNISVMDRDSGHSAELTISCIQTETSACDVFSISTEKVSEGEYVGIISLSQPLDFETRSGYSLVLQATDANPQYSLTTTANVAVDVKDVQDQPPLFLNAPYSATLPENTSPGKSVVMVRARDGDMGESRYVSLSLEGDALSYFTLKHGTSGVATVVTSDVPIDREHPTIIQNGGVYTFMVKATELINNELPGDFSTERITVVITDVDDQVPSFNKQAFQINVSEDIGVGTPLPGLNMVVTDADVGSNARYSLALVSQDRQAERWFSVEPSQASGRTPVVIRLSDNVDFDYDSGLRDVRFTVVTYIRQVYGEEVEVASSEVLVNIMDANDNSPVFANPGYSFVIPEDLALGTKIANVTATDKDSGLFGQITYTLKGFGMDKFGTELQHGNVYLLSKVDYEKQKSYSLTLEARDGGGRVATVNLLVQLTDVNDNAPVFELSEYRRTVREGATNFQPQFFIRATDADKDGHSVLNYRVISSNSDILTVDSASGEVNMTAPVSSAHTSRGQYEMMVRASDEGSSSLYADVPVFVRVGVPGNQRPVFRGTPYNATIPESAPPDTAVITVRATDPDGPDSQVQYRIANGADNFYINKTSGVISVSRAAIMDPEISSTSRYEVTVLAIDNGTPIRETAQTTVTINIADVNNKPPVFPDNANYVRYISEKTKKGETVLKVTATDPDLNADLEYALVEPIRAVDKTGITLKENSVYDYKHAFKINATTGEIQLNLSLDHQVATVIILTVQARDKRAAVDYPEQLTKVEVTLYIQAYNELNPKFTVAGWSPSDPNIRVNVPEEMPIGSTVLRLIALDSPTNRLITQFAAITNLPPQLNLQSSGNIVLLQRLDYETTNDKTLSFRVQAISEDRQRRTEALVLLHVEDINDHTPKFEQNAYKASVLETAANGTLVLTVRATDGDLPRSPSGFGSLQYSSNGENAALFTVNPLTGEIKISGSGVIDRERNTALRFYVTASDTPKGSANQKRSSVPVTVEVLDVNDNAPRFSNGHYSAVVLENVETGTSVINITATDVDTGPGGEVEYELVDQGEANGLFMIKSLTGELKTAKALTGKGRTEPYSLTLRALDRGEPSLFTDVNIKLFIGDVVTNDGVPKFSHPTLDEMAYISENSSIGSPVFRVVASDPDDPNSPEGRLQFSFLHDGSDSLAFNIDGETGLITTRQALDRETKDRYSLILVARDSGMVPQQATRVLHVHVTDIDDHKPVFKRALDEVPLEFIVVEEKETGYVIGKIHAIDLDIGENANIGYLITYGNEDNLFALNRTEDNKAMLSVANRLDRETAAEHLITIKCFKLSALSSSLRKPYNRQDPSEMQVRIKIKDIDDNLPAFADNNVTVGIRVNVPINTLLVTLSAKDIDVDATPILFAVESTVYSPALGGPSLDNATLATLFTLDNLTGEIRTGANMAAYSDAHFSLRISASNRPMDAEQAYAMVKVFVVRDRGLLRYVFARTPVEVRNSIEDFRRDVEAALSVPAALNVYDTQFHAKRDGSLDFSATSSCFQLVGGPQIYDVREMERLLRQGVNPKVDKVYSKYSVQSVQRCAPTVAKAEVTWVQLCLLGIACFIGLASFISGCVLCCSYNRWRRIR